MVAVRPCMASATAARLCGSHARSCVLACLSVGSSGASFDLYSSPDSSWMLFFYQNPKVLHEADRPQYKHNYIKGGESIPFSSKISIEIRRNRDPIRDNRGQNKVYHSPILISCLSPSKTKSWDIKEGDKPLATLLRQRMNNQSIWLTCAL